MQSKADKLWVKWINTYYIKGEGCDELRNQTKPVLDSEEHIENKRKSKATYGKYHTIAMYRDLRGEKLKFHGKSYSSPTMQD